MAKENNLFFEKKAAEKKIKIVNFIIRSNNKQIAEDLIHRFYILFVWQKDSVLSFPKIVLPAEVKINDNLVVELVKEKFKINVLKEDLRMIAYFQLFRKNIMASVYTYLIEKYDILDNEKNILKYKNNHFLHLFDEKISGLKFSKEVGMGLVYLDYEKDILIFQQGNSLSEEEVV